MSDPLETRTSYLRRVIPDVNEIELLIARALRPGDVGDGTFYLDRAIAKTQKLFGDLTRARLAE